MRTGSVFVLLVITLIAYCNGFTSAESAVEVNNQHIEAVNTRTSDDFTRRNLRVAVANGEERGLTFLDKLPNILKRNPGLSKQVESLQNNPTKLKALEKSSFTTKLRAYFKNLSDNSSKTEKAVMAATIILFLIGAPLVWTYSHW